MNNEILIYQTEDNEVAVRLDGERDTLWLNQKQMATLFDKDVRTISEHLKNIYKEQELDEKATVQKFRIVQLEGKREVKREIEHYSLDAIISVGYRVNSKKGTQFRIWATQRLRDYLVDGYAINQQRFDSNAAELKQAIALIRKAAQSPELTAEAGSGLVEIVSRYTQTFLWLQQYDEGLLNEPSGEVGGKLPTVDNAMHSLNTLKASLIERGEATDLFARVREEGLDAIFGNLEQSVFGEPAYPTIESKAAHLLYFVVKNHPFSDGNKRSGAFLFVDFLHRNGRLFNERDEAVINDTGLAALTLLIAGSDPKQKEMLIRLVMTMLAEEQ
ncbi:MAG: virulence protein RhuM/Fic/DOC family protein [Methylophaga sp.]|nr:virulence protein RhuM/Fic/DOC family protein [Methylophaga sp.]